MPSFPFSPCGRGCAAARRREGARVFASPLARRLAKSKGLDIATLLGSGPHGRIVLKDVENAKPGACARCRGCAKTGGPACGHGRRRGAEAVRTGLL